LVSVIAIVMEMSVLSLCWLQQWYRECVCGRLELLCAYSVNNRPWIVEAQR